MPLSEHEKKLLARMGVHPGVKQAQIRKFLPRVARHLVEHRTLAVDHLVVTEDEHEVLMEGVQQ